MLVTVVTSLALSVVGAPSVYGDGRDAWTLLDPHPTNRNLFEQLAAPAQHFRLGRDHDWFGFLADSGIASQQSLTQSPQSRFHGSFVLDAYAAARPLSFVDVNLNLLMFNPSASDGYRISSQIYAGLALHLFYDQWMIAGHPLELDALGTDLGLVTLGQGLLLERYPLEGYTLGLGWRDLYLRHVFGGRVYWDDDDLIAFAFGMLDGAVELGVVRWQFGDDLGNPAAHYATLSLDWALNDWLRVSGEYGMRLSRLPETAAMFRIDLLKRWWLGMDIHFGYQGRYYGRGFGPRTFGVDPSTPLNYPAREDVYVTNSFEFFGVSPWFDQWSHSVFFEARVPLFDHLFVYMTGEIIRRTVSDRDGLGRVAFVGTERAPGSWTEQYYRAGLEVRPWMTRPHRINVFFTNKQVTSADRAASPVTRRFFPGEFVVVEAEVFL